MSKQENEYAAALANLDEHDDEFREAFHKHANKDGQIKPDSTDDLINDFSVILAIDCEPAVRFFKNNNKNASGLKYDGFMDLFKQWLKKESGAVVHHVPKFKPTFDIPHESKKESKAEPEENHMLITRSVTTKSTRTNTVKFKDPVPNYQNNRRLLDSLLNKKVNGKAKLEEMYNERLFEEGQTQVNVQDIFIVLQEWFYLDTIDIKEHEDDEDDFFRNLGSFQRYYTIVEGFLISEKKMVRGGFDVRQIELSFAEMLELLDFWLQSDYDVILVHRNDNNNNEDGSVKKMLLETIAKYEKMIKEAKTEVEKQVLEGTVASLREKLAQLERGNVNDPELSEEEKRRRKMLREIAFKEIFAFYCTQQLNTGRTATFDRVGRLSNTINLGTYTVLLKNFGLKYDHLKLLELYKKAAGQDENLDYNEFEDLMNKVAVRAELITEVKVHEPRPEIMKSYKPDSYKNDPTYRKFKKQDDKRREEAAGLIVKNAKEAYVHQVKRNEKSIEKVWEHMGIYDGTYKNRIGFVQLPFGSHDKQNFRIPPDSLNYKFRTRAMEGKSVEEIKEEVAKRNELRKLIKDLKSVEKSMMSNYRQTNSLDRSTNLHLNTSRSREPREESTYTKRQGQKVRGHGVNDMNKLTLKKIEALLYGDIRKVDEKFNPSDLIDDNDEEDNMYLAEYNLNAEKKRIKANDEAEKKRLDGYGKLKKPARGFAMNGKYGHAPSYSQSPPPAYNHYQDQYPHMEIQTDPSYYMDSYSTGPTSYGGTYSTKNSGYYNDGYYGSNPGLPAKKSMVSAKNIRNPTYLEYGGPGANAASPGSYSSNVGLGSAPSMIGYGGNYNNNNGNYGAKNGYLNAMGRANQIEQEAYRREQQMINNVMNIQNNQMRKGMRAVGK